MDRLLIDVSSLAEAMLTYYTLITFSDDVLFVTLHTQYRATKTAAFGPPLWHYHTPSIHADVIKWKHFLRYCPFVRVIHRSPVDFPHKGQWRGALIFSLIYTWTNGWAKNQDAGDLRRHCIYYNVIVMATNAIDFHRFLHACTTLSNAVAVYLSCKKRQLSC